MTDGIHLLEQPTLESVRAPCNIHQLSVSQAARILHSVLCVCVHVCICVRVFLCLLKLCVFTVCVCCIEAKCKSSRAVS